MDIVFQYHQSRVMGKEIQEITEADALELNAGPVKESPGPRIGNIMNRTLTLCNQGSSTAPPVVKPCPFDTVD